MNDRPSRPAPMEPEARAVWAARIGAAWRASIEGIFAAGRLLAEAKRELPHGAFAAMIERDLPFKRSTTFRLMAIAADPRLVDGAHVQHLPPHWGTLYELTKLDNDRFAAKLKSGEINPDMLRRDVANESRLLARARDEERVVRLGPIEGRFRTLIFDPPLESDWLSPAVRAQPGYACMTHEELKAMAPTVAGWAADPCHAYIWTPNNFAANAHELMALWGFAYKITLTWVKPRWGYGSYFRNQTEHVLFGVKGNLMTRSDSISTVFEAPLGEHSEKPEEFYQIVRKASYPPYGEAFSASGGPTS
jgi:N6-adenosine-specific RNA methylase IME4